jgi:hypothetical protein
VAEAGRFLEHVARTEDPLCVAWVLVLVLVLVLGAPW